ncbi:hypothetical protein [Nocardia cyriacigeorgica]|uniref:hypothetical protein n=1 Tax=Nocardia cyriacigeorgica TaxID=135487 RepID=UPI001895D72F|nr:hypothetical protein [Nocardia cyriacigeorgica]MBF6437029.1 hypothetical protein [Nocardia cyriacigeorgica]
MTGRGSDPTRLTVVDEIFLRTHRGLGTPIALQGLWRTGDRVEPRLLRDLHARLRRGPLGRRVVRARVPGARRSWHATVRAHPLDLHGGVATSEVLGWADTLGGDLDPEYAPGWRLSSAPVHDGGTVIALTCSHVLADARGLIIAVDAALTGQTCEPATEPHSDWADAWAQLATVLGGTTAVLGSVLRRWTSPAAHTSAAGRAPGSGAARPPAITGRDHARAEGMRQPIDTANTADDPCATPLPAIGAILCLDAEQWDRIAATSGGTANSLFIWCVANTLWAGGFPASTIDAALPVDTRDEPRVDNDLAMTAITVTRADSPGVIRAKARTAYEHRMTSPAGLPEETLQLVPDRLAYTMSRGAGERDILCSNIGTLPPSLHSFGSHECTAIAARAIHPGLTFARRPRTRLSGYLSRDRDTYTLALVSLAPELVPNSAALHRLAEETVRSVGLSPRGW